jgi:hypothetical protein
MHLNEELDEMFLYENSPTLAELRDFEALGYIAPEASAGYGLRQTQNDGVHSSPAASRQRARSAPQSAGEVGGELLPGSPISVPVSRVGTPAAGARLEPPLDALDTPAVSIPVYVRDPPMPSPVKSRSSNRAVAAVTGASGSGVSVECKARPASPDYKNTKFQLNSRKAPPTFSPHSNSNNTSSHAAALSNSASRSPSRGISDAVLNDMAGGLMGQDFVPPPVLSAHDYPPQKQEASGMGRKHQSLGNLSHAPGCGDADDASVNSLESFGSLLSGQRGDGNTNTNTLNLNTVDMQLMSKYGSPPKPSFGSKLNSRAQSPTNSVAPVQRGSRRAKNGREAVGSGSSSATGGHRNKHSSPQRSGSPPILPSSSLATLLVSDPPMQMNTALKESGSLASLASFASHNTDMSLNKVRPGQTSKLIQANFTADKQNRIAFELQNRLMLTKW